MRRIVLLLGALALPLGVAATAAADVGSRPQEPKAGRWQTLS
jgi:hypothetical protein